MEGRIKREKKREVKNTLKEKEGEIKRNGGEREDERGFFRSERNI